MEADPAIEFELFVAQKLGRTRDELRATMSQSEYLDWCLFYARKAQREELAMKRAGG
jgi:hypothetical protein